MRTKEEIFEAVRNWEMDAGESFLDYFDGSINLTNFVSWSLGKGYMTEEKFHAWEAEEYNFISGDEILFSEEEFSIVREPEFTFNDRDNHDKEYDKAQMILAEFLSSSKTYQKRVDEFLKEN